MVGDYVAVIGERFVAKGAYAVLVDYFAIKELSHLVVGADFPVSPRVLLVLNAPNTHLAPAPFFGNSFSATAR